MFVPFFSFEQNQVQSDPDPELLFCSEEPFTPDVQVQTEESEALNQTSCESTEVTYVTRGLCDSFCCLLADAQFDRV